MMADMTSETLGTMPKRRAIAIAVAALLLLAACGREGVPGEVSSLGDASPSPSASATAAASATPSATKKAAAASATPSATAAAPQASAGASETASPGTFRRPTGGRYTYSYEGEGTDPTNPAGPERSFEGKRYTEVSHSANDYTFVGTNSEDTTRSTTKTRWSSTKVELTYIEIQTQVGTFKCKFDPPLVITRFPVKPETYPSQTFKGEGNACDGKLEITVVKREQAKDATGKSWDAWQVKVHTETRSSNFDITTDETRWVAPDLGIEVRSNANSNGNFKIGASSGKINNTTVSVLEKYP
jgi:hypothetical protein